MTFRNKISCTAIYIAKQQNIRSSRKNSREMPRARYLLSLYGFADAPVPGKYIWIIITIIMIPNLSVYGNTFADSARVMKIFQRKTKWL